ncbi:hypothetical protein CRENBAI_026607 [Crenichthys baileyi]|uniref:Uncharacterized protein n=1 Tax=Crenichthys baileyi TaxID=28760 RepID=A0AAV9RHE8_9TELE
MERGVEGGGQLIAEDADSGLNGAILYSIFSGNQDNEFFIDPISGIIKVNKPLDREKVPSYSLAVRALDNGTPPMSSTAVVSIEISDINDNPPTFFPANLTAVIQENKPIGTRILQLSVIDQDSSHNGPPFSFSILSGNDGREFELETGGTLVANQVFRRDIAKNYVLQIQVSDSGKPSFTTRVSFVSPHFHRTSRCTCHDASCAIPLEQCKEQLCPPDMQCVSVEASRGHYACRCPRGKLGECAGHSSLSFSGNSFIKYRLSNQLQMELKLTLRVRTLQSRGIIMYMHNERCIILKVQQVSFRRAQTPPTEAVSRSNTILFCNTTVRRAVTSVDSPLEEGKLWFQLSCAPLPSGGVNGPDMLGPAGRRINDGNWHTVVLELNRNFSSLALDDSFIEQRHPPSLIQTLSPDRTFYFGALAIRALSTSSPKGCALSPLLYKFADDRGGLISELDVSAYPDKVERLTQQCTKIDLLLNISKWTVQPPHSRNLVVSQKDPRVYEGFQGCLDSVMLNNRELPLQNNQSQYAEVVELTELKLGCILYPDACQHQPCRNGASCTSLPSGGSAGTQPPDHSHFGSKDIYHSVSSRAKQTQPLSESKICSFMLTKRQHVELKAQFKSSPHPFHPPWFHSSKKRAKQTE